MWFVVFGLAWLVVLLILVFTIRDVPLTNAPTTAPTPTPTPAPTGTWVELGKYIPNDYTGIPYFGSGYGINGDGTLILTGGTSDASMTNLDEKVGAAWVFERNGLTVNQLGPKLIGTPGTKLGNEAGISMSYDGTTIVLGGTNDGIHGSAWIFVWNGTAYNEQAKLIPTSYIGTPYFGYNAGISYDGNTVMIGGSGDNSGIGAAWVYVRVGTIWTEQAKITPSDTIGASGFAYALGLSSDGNVASLGGSSDNGGNGAFWIYKRTGMIWTEVTKITSGSDMIGTGTYFGNNIAMSGDGKTVAVSSYSDNGGYGAIWVFTADIAGSVYTQQGPKLIGSTISTTPVNVGISLSLNDNGDRLVSGTSNDDGGNGTVQVWDRIGVTWTNTHLLQGSNAIGAAYQGGSVDVSPVGDTIVISGVGDNNLFGAMWVFQYVL